MPSSITRERSNVVDLAVHRRLRRPRRRRLVLPRRQRLYLAASAGSIAVMAALAAWSWCGGVDQVVDEPVYVTGLRIPIHLDWIIPR